MDRTNVLLMIERALEVCFPEQKTAIVRELESRLPTDGRPSNASSIPPWSDPPWWRADDGRYLHVQDIDSEHLSNILALIKRPIEAELKWRGKK